MARQGSASARRSGTILGLAWLCLLLLLATVSPVVADDRVKVFATSEKGFARIIIDFPDRLDLPPYRITSDNGVLTSGSVAASADAWPAYAAIAGLTPDTLGGSEFLIDDKGWLRSAQIGDSGANWNDPATLETVLRTLREQPITGALGGIHVHGR